MYVPASRPGLFGPWVREWLGQWSRLRTLPFREGFRSGLVEIVGVGGPILEFLKLRVLGLPGEGNRVASHRFELLDTAIDSVHVNGLWLEFGVWKGESINRIAVRSGQPVFGFDSFEGLPRAWSLRAPAGQFSLAGELPPVRNGVTLIKGWFDQTLPRFWQEHPTEPIAFVHVDCDLYQSALTVLRSLKDRLVEGSILVFDEFCKPGWIPDDEARAWREIRKETGIRFRWLGCATTGSVALRVTTPAGSSVPRRPGAWLSGTVGTSRERAVTASGRQGPALGGQYDGVGAR